MLHYSIEDYLLFVQNNNYFILILLEDIIIYFNFKVISDNICNDIRYIKLTNSNHGEITIICEFILLKNINRVEKNKITFVNKSNIKKNYEYYGFLYKSNKLI